MRDWSEMILGRIRTRCTSGLIMVHSEDPVDEDSTCS